MGLRWEVPPAPNRKKGAYSDLVAELKKNPGKWARVDTLTKATSAYHLASTLRESGLEATAREIPNTAEGEAFRRWGVWARWAQTSVPSEES